MAQIGRQVVWGTTWRFSARTITHGGQFGGQFCVRRRLLATHDSCGWRLRTLSSPSTLISHPRLPTVGSASTMPGLAKKAGPNLGGTIKRSAATLACGHFTKQCLTIGTRDLRRLAGCPRASRNSRSPAMTPWTRELHTQLQHRAKKKPKSVSMKQIAADESAFADALAKQIENLQQTVVIDRRADVAPSLLSTALLEAGARQLIKVAGPRDEARRIALELDVSSSDLLATDRFRLVDTNLFEHFTPVDYQSVLGDAADPMAWDDPSHPRLTFVAVLPLHADRRSVVAWAFQMGSRDGFFQWGRVPAYMAVPSGVADTMCATGPDCKNYNRLSVMLSAQADVTNLGQLPEIGNAAPLELVRVVPQVNTELLDVHWLNYCLIRLLLRRATLGQAARTLAPGSAQIIAAAGLDPDMDVGTLTPEDHVRLANILSQSPHRPDLDLTESYMHTAR